MTSVSSGMLSWRVALNPCCHWSKSHNRNMFKKDQSDQAWPLSRLCWHGGGGGDRNSWQNACFILCLHERKGKYYIEQEVNTVASTAPRPNSWEAFTRIPTYRVFTLCPGLSGLKCRRWWFNSAATSVAAALVARVASCHRRRRTSLAAEIPLDASVSCVWETAAVAACRNKSIGRRCPQHR